MLCECAFHKLLANGFICQHQKGVDRELTCTHVGTVYHSVAWQFFIVCVKFHLSHSVYPPLGSGSARFNAEQMAKTVQARIEANRTSQRQPNAKGPNIYAREPNRKNSIFIGNLTWV